MSEFNNDQFYTGNEPLPTNPGFLANLPNATVILVLGIASIVLSCCLYGTGIVTGIIALIMAKKAKVMYAANPAAYNPSSLKNVNAGRITAIVGIILGVIILVCVVIVIAMFGIETLGNQELLKQKIEAMQAAQ